MDMKYLTLNILENLDRDYGEIAKKKHGKTPQILLGDLILSILENDIAKNVCTDLNIAQQTFNRMIKRMFPDVKLNGGNETWKWYLINQSSYKRCSDCKTFKRRDDFTKDISRSDGLDQLCKECKQLKNTWHYNLHKDGYYKDYYNEHYSEYLARGASCRTKRLHRYVKWADNQKIKEIYKNCPAGYHVDHVIPLNGKLVSGLHVETNLQYLTKEENLKKSNKFNTDVAE